MYTRNKRKQYNCARVKMKKTLIVVLAFIAFASFLIAGCASEEDKAKGMLYTAQLETHQFAEERAEKLFKAIIVQYPQTKAAKTAKEELEKLKQKNKTPEVGKKK